MRNTKGRGGQPPKVSLVTKSGWASDLKAATEAFDRRAANFTIAALETVKAPPAVYPQALKIMRTYYQQWDMLDSPRTSADKNGQGIGRFKDDLKRRASKMADQLHIAMLDDRSQLLDGMIGAASLRSHMEGAYDSLVAIAEMLDRAEEGVAPLSGAQIRHEAGSALKRLAREHSLPLIEFVAAFQIYPSVGHHTNDAFIKWYQRLNG